ncbi:MAG: SRPBCC family protein [Cyclobacteriaceae bacterium]
MEIKVQVTINKPIAEVWEVMGNQFGHAHLWSSNFQSSKPGGIAKFEGIDYSLRDTTTPNGNTLQELTEFDASNFSLRYEITAGRPEIARSVSSHWYLEESAEGTVVYMDSVMEPKMELPAEMAEKIQLGLMASFNQLANELKYYLENGVPHPDVK